MYATPDYYTNEYGGTLISQEELHKALQNASSDIDHLCFGRIQGMGFECLYPRQKKLIQDAVCMQADYIKQYSPMLNAPLKAYKVGSTDVDLADIRCNGIATSQEVINKLEDTGLRCRVL